MAKQKAQTATTRLVKPKVSRKGVHAKTKTSTNVNSKNYKKPNVGQGM